MAYHEQEDFAEEFAEAENGRYYETLSTFFSTARKLAKQMKELDERDDQEPLKPTPIPLTIVALESFTSSIWDWSIQFSAICEDGQLLRFMLESWLYPQTRTDPEDYGEELSVFQMNGKGYWEDA